MSAKIFPIRQALCRACGVDKPFNNLGYCFTCFYIKVGMSKLEKKKVSSRKLTICALFVAITIGLLVWGK